MMGAPPRLNLVRSPLPPAPLAQVLSIRARCRSVATRLTLPASNRMVAVPQSSRKTSDATNLNSLSPVDVGRYLH
jgi:hypothetical protein